MEGLGAKVRPLKLAIDVPLLACSQERRAVEFGSFEERAVNGGSL
jgi:hypothetical protein